MKRSTRFADLDGGYAAAGNCSSFGWSAAAWSAISTAVAVGTTVYTTDQARKNSNNANDLAIKNAKANAQQADESNNRANAKSPDSAAMLAANLAAGKQGASGTLLTGPGGVDPGSLTLGRNSLLGG